MADLLECLLQIKGLRETVDRLAALVTPDALAQQAAPNRHRSAVILQRLADAEERHAAWLRAILSADRPALSDPAGEEPATPGGDDAAGIAARFLHRRRENLEILDRCSAADLSRTGLHPVRGAVSVADIVALMLANDADCVGEIRCSLAP